ncbi:MAG: TSUP family transporter [Chloroflexi bacterium]|nr:TSUP family transporter [Chloroflexota bacterium]
MALLFAGIILFGGSIVQGAIGFALGMIAVPLLVEAGYSLSQAVALTTLAIGIQVAFGVWQLREHIPWGDVKLAALLRYLTVPLGIFLLLHIENMDTIAVKRLVGCGLLLGVFLRLLARGQKARDLPLPISIATFALSGLLQGLVAMGGPPLVLWMTTRSFRAHQTRAFTKTLFLLNAPLQVLLLLLLSQTMSADVLGTALLLTPLIFAGTTIGLRIGNRLSKARLNAVALALLVVIALNAIF